MPTIVTIGLDEIGFSINQGISHVAVGDGDTAESIADVRLDNETYRKAPDSKGIDSGLIAVRTFFSFNDLPAEIKEVGVFSRGSGAPNSGVLLGRWVTSIFRNQNDLTLWIFMTVDRASP